MAGTVLPMAMRGALRVWQDLELLRGVILALILQEKVSSLNAAFDHYSEHPAEALRLLTQTIPLQCP